MSLKSPPPLSAAVGDARRAPKTMTIIYRSGFRPPLATSFYVFSTGWGGKKIVSESETLPLSSPPPPTRRASFLSFFFLTNGDKKLLFPPTGIPDSGHPATPRQLYTSNMGTNTGCVKRAEGGVWKKKTQDIRRKKKSEKNNNQQKRRLSLKFNNSNSFEALSCVQKNKVTLTHFCLVQKHRSEHTCNPTGRGLRSDGGER